jgi:pantoate--beta-alanine ligase
MRRYTADKKHRGRSIGLVPTMGYLHEGHASLMRLAREHADDIVTSVFVNPTQFAPNEDFNRYPRDLDRDLALAQEAGVDAVFAPSVAEMYPGGFATSVQVRSISLPFEGVSRPTHFEGVATVVTKLFNIVGADVAVFGQKDFQQCVVIRQFVRDLNIPIRIVIAPTVREADGLAMSSRNVYLSPESRQSAAVLYRALRETQQCIESGETRRAELERILVATIAREPQAEIDYAAVADAVTLVQPDNFAPGQQVVLLLAVRFGSTRLIDNAVVTVPWDVQ